MNKKILIGSIIAVAILVLVSFTSVVGYNSVESDLKPSPLFNVRSSRAVEEEGMDFTTDYVGKGEELTIPLPDRNNIEVLIEKVIDRISKMDDKSFDRFVKLIKAHINQNNRINDKEIAFVSIQPVPFCILLWIFAIPMYIIVQLFFMIPLRILCLFIPIVYSRAKRQLKLKIIIRTIALAFVSKINKKKERKMPF